MTYRGFCANVASIVVATTITTEFKVKWFIFTGIISMITFNATIHKFAKQGEKTGWTYIEISASQAKKLKPETKVSFRVKGTLDAYAIQKTALLPMGDGKFIMPLNAALRKGIGKKEGEKLKVSLEADEREIELSRDLMKCLKDDPQAMAFFKTLTKGHQQYFSKWIESAKTTATKTKRIVMALTAFGKKQGYPEMMRENKRNNF